MWSSSSAMFTGEHLALLQRHPDAVVIIWNPHDYDHVFFVTLSQLIPCLKQMKADHWSMIVFWNEGSGSRPSTGAGDDDDTPGPSGYQDPVVPDETMPHDDPGDDSPDLGGTGGGPLGPGPGPPDNQGGNDSDLPSGEIEFQYGPGGNPPFQCRYQMIVIHPWSSYLMEFMVRRLMMMTIRLIRWKFIRSLLRLEDLRMHQGQNNRSQILTRLCNRHLICRKPLLNRLFHFRNIRIFRFRESCVRRHLGMFR